MNYELEDFKEKINLDDLFARKQQVEQNKIKVYLILRFIFIKKSMKKY